MKAIAALIAPAAHAWAIASTSPASTLSALAIAVAAVPEGIALMPPADDEIDIEHLPSSFLPALSGASDTRLPSIDQLLVPLTFGAPSGSLPDDRVAARRSDPRH